MVRKTYTPEQIINKLREAEVLLSQGATKCQLMVGGRASALRTYKRYIDTAAGEMKFIPSARIQELNKRILIGEEMV